MQHPESPSAPPPRSGSGDDKVIRLPVTDDGLSGRLEAMPAPPKQVRLRPAPTTELHEDGAQEAMGPTPAELGVPWEEENAPPNRTPMGWLVLVSALLLTLGGWALAKLAEGEARVEERAERVVDTWDEETRSRREALALVTKIEATLESYLLAGDITEKAKYVRHPRRVVPLMEAYYERHEFRPARLDSIEDLCPLGIENRPFLYVGAKLADGEIRHLSMELTRGGGLKVDWESEVAYQPMSIEQFIEERPSEAMEFRVYARIDSYYNFEFSDQERYQALLLTERDSSQFLFGYVERGTEDGEQLMKMLLPEFRLPIPVILRVRALPGSRAMRSVLVEKLVSPRWVYAVDPAASEATPGGGPAR